MNQAPVIAYCLEWHATTSDAFQEVLVEPLRPHIQVLLKPWDGQATDAPAGAGEDAPVMFLQVLPPESLLRNPRARVVWAPMYDHVGDAPAEWWAQFPRTLRVLAFSEAVARPARAAGLPTLSLRWFPDPEQEEAARWDAGRVLCYWNRTGMVGPDFLEKLCRALRVRKLVFQGVNDPGAPPWAAYDLPARIGGTEVERLPQFLPKEEYRRATREANLFLAPRLREGIGVSFLRAMSRGCAVLGYDAPTMNEYIAHGRSGVLLGRTALEAALSRIRRRLTPGGRAPQPYPVSCDRDWRELSRLDAESLGAAARAEHRAGFESWRRALPELARFIADWTE